MSKIDTVMRMVEEALRTQTQYTMQPTIGRMNAARAAKDALHDYVKEALSAKTESQPVALFRTSGSGSPVCTEDFLKAHPEYRHEYEQPLILPQQESQLLEAAEKALKVMRGYATGFMDVELSEHADELEAAIAASKWSAS